MPGIFEVGLGGDSPAFEDELAALDALDDELVAYELSLTLGGLACGPREGHTSALVHDPSYRDQLLASAAGDARSAALARSIFEDPGALRSRYVHLLDRYWDEAFRTEWERILPRIEAEVTDGARALITGGPAGLVNELLPEGRWDPTALAIVVDKNWTGVFDIAERGQLLFVPTVYGWPAVLIEIARPWPVSIIFPLRDLDAAGVVSGHRDGYFVLYELRPERLDVLGRALRSTLGLAHAGSGDVPALPVSLGRTAER